MCLRPRPPVSLLRSVVDPRLCTGIPYCTQSCGLHRVQTETPERSRWRWRCARRVRMVRGELATQDLRQTNQGVCGSLRLDFHSCSEIIGQLRVTCDMIEGIRPYALRSILAFVRSSGKSTSSFYVPCQMYGSSLDSIEFYLTNENNDPIDLQC